MLRNSKPHKKPEDTLASYKRWEFFIKNASDLLSALGKFGLFLGILNVFLYVLKIGFMPPGLSLSDSITFIFTFLAVSFISIVGTTYGSICLFWLYFMADGFQNKRWWRNKHADFQPKSQLPSWAQSWLWAIMSLIVFVIFFPLLNSKEINNSSLLFFYSMAWAGLLFSLAVLAQNDPVKNGITRTIRFVLFAAIPIIIAFISNGEIFSIAMKVIGVRYENVSIETTSENIKRVRSLTKAFKIYVKTCPLTETEHQLIPNANILWTGIGNRTLVELVNSRTYVELNDAPKKFLYVQFDSSTISPVYAHIVHTASNRATINPCIAKDK